MTYLIQSVEDDFDCYYVDLDEDNYITSYKPVDVDDLVFDDHKTKHLLETKPDLENSYFQIEPAYFFNAWKI